MSVDERPTAVAVNRGPAPIVIWLASYPKSGNTWLRALVHGLLGGPLDRSEDLQRSILDGHKLTTLPAADGTCRPIKTHWLPQSIPFRHRMAGFVYLARNPWDVALSNFDYDLLCGLTTADLATERARYLDRFIAERGDPRWRGLGMGSWSEHVRAWHGLRERLPHLWLRYEDLLAEPVRETMRLARYLGLSPDAAAIERAIEGASFATMRRLEEAEIGRAQGGGLFGQRGFEAGHRAGRRFINRGQATWGRDLAPAQIRRLGETFAAELELLGYPRHPDVTPTT